MNRFIETICFENGAFARVPYHARRMNRTRREVLGIETPLCLEEVLDAEAADAVIASATLPEGSQGLSLPPRTARVKCRVEYAAGILAVSYAFYRPRPVSSLRLVEAGSFDYRYKYADRLALQRLFDRRQEADDILLTRDGELTDTSICNIALFDGTAWHTPRRPLLAGTRREALLDAGLLLPRCIRREDLPRYTRIRLFNALLDFGEIDLPAEAIWG